MADKCSKNQNPDALENLPSGELQQHIEEQKKKMKHSLRMALTALIALIAVCIAWFVANMHVSATGASVSAESSNDFALASVGERQSTEEQYLKDESGKNLLSEGIIVKNEYTYYVDLESGKKEEKEQTYYVGYSGLAWHLNGQKKLVPGAGGKLEFYIIPKKDNISKVTITVNLEGYKKAENKAVGITDTRSENLLKGHVLLFRTLDDKYGYQGWLGENNKFTVEAPGLEKDKTVAFTKNVPYKITLYWKWPQYFRNYIYTDRTTQGDLFTDAIEQGEGSEYQTFINFLKSQQTLNSSNKLFYDKDQNNSTNSISGSIDNTMSDEMLASLSNYYNQADEYIGTNVNYVYIRVDVE